MPSPLAVSLNLQWMILSVVLELTSRIVTDSPMISAMARLPNVKAQIDSMQPLKGLGDPEDIVGPAVFLASNDASWVTGHCLAVEGGYLAQ
jgi:NAD(P)-dependent dehydrogenase (short-subunit alcohol dehydrogenase family)